MWKPNSLYVNEELKQAEICWILGYIMFEDLRGSRYEILNEILNHITYKTR